jgi:spermidine synthase
VLYALFFLSGAAGLIYESIWTRYLALLVGHSAYAQILVLTIFLGGMAVGSLLVGRYSERLRNPLILYAVVEAGVGLLGLLFHPTFRAVSAAAYDSIFPALVSSPGAQSAVKWLLAATLILPQSILLGATFPLISAGILRRWTSRPGSILSWLYASNSLGAAVGVLLAGFYLVSRFDFPGTLTVATALNFAVAIITVALVKGRGKSFARVEQATSERSTVAAFPAGQGVDSTRQLLLGAAFGTAVASFAYEIAWIRMLSLVLGSATHSFELMLSAFILGLSLGALAVGRVADRWRDPLRALGFIQCAMGALAVATLPLYMASFHWIGDLIGVFPKTSSGYVGFTIARYAICLAVMLPATFCAGTTLPLITRILYRNGKESAIGEVYAANTAGSIVGVQLAGLLLLPILGLKLLLVSGAALDVAIGLILLYVALPRGAPLRTPTLAKLAIASVLLLFAASRVRFDRQLLSSGVYRFGGLPARGEFTITFYKDGRTSTVTVKREPDGNQILSTNGKPDASVPGDWLGPHSARKRGPLRDDVSTQVLLPLIAMAHAPRATSAAVIGQGSGMTSHMLLGSPTLRQLATIEIEPEMIRASTQFKPVNHRVFGDPRARFVVDDARSYFAGAGHRFDLIVSEPSNPWVSGVAGLFTTEFYARIKGYLAPGGVFAQWMHLYEMNDSLALTMLAAVQQNFSAYDIYLTDDTDIVIIATNAVSVPAPDWGVTQWPGIAEDLDSVTSLRAASFAALHLADSKVLWPLVASVRANSDFAPALDLGAEKARYLLTHATGLQELNETSFDIVAALSGRRLPLAEDGEVLANVPRLLQRARSAKLLAFRLPLPASRSPLHPGDSTDADSEYVALRERRLSFDTLLSARTPPPEWLRWVPLLFEADRDAHGGSPGSLDTTFYRPIDGFLDRVGAPPAVRQAAQFLKAADRWDFEAVQRLGDELIRKARDGEVWIPVDYLRDATVTAHLKNGDMKGARAAFDALLPMVSRGADTDLRTRLLRAHITDTNDTRGFR